MATSQNRQFSFTICFCFCVNDVRSSCRSPSSSRSSTSSPSWGEVVKLMWEPPLSSTTCIFITKPLLRIVWEILLPVHPRPSWPWQFDVLRTADQRARRGRCPTRTSSSTSSSETRVSDSCQHLFIECLIWRAEGKLAQSCGSIFLRKEILTP